MGGDQENGWSPRESREKRGRSKGVWMGTKSWELNLSEV